MSVRVVGLVLGFGSAMAGLSAMAQPAPPDPGGARTSSIPAGQVFGVFGSSVQDADGMDAGRLWDVLVDESGTPRAAVIDYGGTLGVGRRKVAVAWQMLQFVPADSAHPVHVRLGRKGLGEIPEFKYDKGPMVVGTDR